MGLAVFKIVAGRPAPSRVGSTPTHSRHQDCKLRRSTFLGSQSRSRCGESARFPAIQIAESPNEPDEVYDQDSTVFRD